MPGKKTEAKVYANAEKNLKKLKSGKLGRIAKLKRIAKELIGGASTYKFDPEGVGYDDQTAAPWIRKHPLTIPKPVGYQGDVLQNEGAFQSWQWHPELNDYVKHSGSRHPITGQILKGRGHKTFHLTEQGEKEAGYEIYKGEGDKYYSRKKGK